MSEFQAKDFDERQKIYVLAEFPYPSGEGLHIGHAFFFTGADVYARFQRMRGKNVLFPIGWDAFGLPTENFAIRTGRPPQEVTRKNTETFKRQMRELGYSFDWSRLIDTTDPGYYKWTQWIFIKLYEQGLAYKQEMPINWCPSCKIGLANEEVINGRCERCGTETTRRQISQWVVKITAYADRLIDGLAQTEFIDKVKAAQINWIGRSEGAEIYFEVRSKGPGAEDRDTEASPLISEPDSRIAVFTTRPDTLWGCTFLVVAPEHPLAIQASSNPDVEGYLEAARKKSDLERAELSGEKTGVFSGFSAAHPATGEELPVWISDFVLPSYGTGAIMAVPAHDERDHAFARQYNLSIQPVIDPPEAWDYREAAYTGLAGRVMNSGPLDGLHPHEAIPAAIEWLELSGKGKRSVTYHLRDWIFSRQHYWGEPIPMIYCDRCGWSPVPEEDLPVVLPEVERYQPTDTGESPLANIPEWVNVPCPKCDGLARRETDTMPNWAGSDWYFLRFVDPHNEIRLADMDKLRYWLPVDVYIGGDEHNTLHLLYSRFIYMVLHDIGAVPSEYPEPYIKRLSHGVILGSDGARMSKSRGNVIIPDEMVAAYGADVVRTYLMFIGPFDATMIWNERALQGVRRFRDRFERFIKDQVKKGIPAGNELPPEIHRLIQSITQDLDGFKFNTAVAKLMEALNWATASGRSLNKAAISALLRLLAPFAPFTAQSLWEIIGASGSIHTAGWPAFDPEQARADLLEISIQVNGKLRGTLQIRRGETEETIKERAAALESVQKHLQAGAIRKVIYVPERTISFVVA